MRSPSRLLHACWMSPFLPVYDKTIVADTLTAAADADTVSS